MMRQRNQYLLPIIGVALIGLTAPQCAGQLPAASPLAPRIDPPAAEGAMAPRLTNAPGGPVLTWLEPARASVDADANVMRLWFSRFVHGEWSEARTIVERDDFFANWADVPGLIVTGNGSMIAWWLQKSSAGTYSYDVMLARSADGGESWTTLGRAHDDASPIEHGFVSAIARDNGVRLFWLDGRAMAADDGEAGGDGHDHGHGGGEMQLRTTLVTDRVAPSQPLDLRVCECCQTAAAATPRGPVVVYRDRDHGEVRDIAIVRRVDGEWHEPAHVHADGWGIAACPVNGPAVAARDDRMAVAWFTGAEFAPRVQIAFAGDGEDGESMFTAPMIVDGEAALGRVSIALTQRGEAVVGWLTTDAYGGIIRLRTVAPDGRMSRAIDVARTSPERRSGVPQLALLDDSTALLVWTHAARPTTLRAATVRLPEIAPAAGDDDA